MGKYSCITNWLLKKAADQDKSTFEKWRNGKLTTEECKKEFMKQNEFPELAPTIISDELFVEWLNSIGWRRLTL